MAFKFVPPIASVGSITPFVETPDGRTLFGTPFPLLTPPAQTLTDTTPVYDTYHFGVVIAPGVAVNLTLEVDVNATPARGAETRLSLAIALALLASDQQQVTMEYTYGKPTSLPN